MVSGDMRAMYKEKKTKMIIIRLWIGNTATLRMMETTGSTSKVDWIYECG